MPATYPFGKKYLVQRHDGSVPEWPWFVLGGCDPFAPRAVLYYAGLVEETPAETLLLWGIRSEEEKKVYVNNLVELSLAMEYFAADRTRVALQEEERPATPAAAEALALPREIPCPWCEGHGRNAGIGCAKCEGSGKYGVGAVK